MRTTTKENICFEILCDEVSRRLRSDDRAVSDDVISGVLFSDKSELTYKDLDYHFKWGVHRINKMVEEGVITPIRTGRNAAFSTTCILQAIRRGLKPLNQPVR